MRAWPLLPFLDLRSYPLRNLRADVLAAVTVMFMTVPQGIAYAMIAGLPPALGLYTSALPTTIGALFRSSRHVIPGPTNGLSLLVAGAVAVPLEADPATVAFTLATMVGLLQVSAGVLGLGALLDFISSAVVVGYVTGAGLLIGVGQLPNLTRTAMPPGPLWDRLSGWVNGLEQAHLTTVLMGLGTAAIVVILRRVHRRLPGLIIAMVTATLVSVGLSLPEQGLLRIADLQPVPRGLPPLSLPDLRLMPELLPLAVAAAMLSLVESSAVSRAIAGRTGQHLHSGAEFFGQGLANLAAGFFSGYPVSGSLSRSALNEQAGAKSRLAGVLGGLLMFPVLWILGPIVNETPIAALAGILLVVAWDLVDRIRIRVIMTSTPSDRITFLATLLGTWTLSLDQAIYVGVGVSLVFFLRQARLLTVRELAVDPEGVLHEVGPLSDETTPVRPSPHVRIIQLEGRLFFGVEGDLRNVLDDATENDAIRVLIVRLKRTQGMDVTVAQVLEETAQKMRAQGRHLVLAGVPKPTYRLLERTRSLPRLGPESVFMTQDRWFESLKAAIAHANDLLKTSSTEPLEAIRSETLRKMR